MNTIVIKGWILNGEPELEWCESSHKAGVSKEIPVVYKHKGTKKDAADYGYDFPPKRVKITIEID